MTGVSPWIGRSPGGILTPMSDRVILAMTGGSGAAYARRLLERLLRADGDEPPEIHLIVSEAAGKVIEQELQVPIDVNDETSVRAVLQAPAGDRVVWHHAKDVAAPPASGSFRTRGMVIVPCSTGTLGRIASGASTNLIERSADVCLKERRRLILVPRETPYSRIHLENMLRVTDAGAVVLPASPGLYHNPRSVEDLVDFVVDRILDHLGYPHLVAKRYGADVPVD